LFCTSHLASFSIALCTFSYDSADRDRLRSSSHFESNHSPNIPGCPCQDTSAKNLFQKREKKRKCQRLLYS
jgi:hypothetical protein